MVDFSPARGSEQAGRRPAVIVSNDVANQHSPVVIVAAVTSKQVERRAQLPVCVRIRPGVLPEDSVILANQLMTIDKSRLERHRGDVTAAQQAELDAALKVSLGIRP